MSKRKKKRKQSRNTIEEVKEILSQSEEVLSEVFEVGELKTDDVRSLICGGWFNHDTKIEVYVFHRCDFYEIRISRMEEDGTNTRLGCYILVGLQNGFDTHLCYYNDGKKDIYVGYNAYRDELVLSPSGMEFVRTTMKSWDRFAESMRLDSNDKANAFDQEDQIFRKGYVTIGDGADDNEINNAFADLLGHSGSVPPTNEL